MGLTERDIMKGKLKQPLPRTVLWSTPWLQTWRRAV